MLTEDGARVLQFREGALPPSCCLEFCTVLTKKFVQIDHEIGINYLSIALLSQYRSKEDL